MNKDEIKRVILSHTDFYKDSKTQDHKQALITDDYYRGYLEAMKEAEETVKFAFQLK